MLGYTLDISVARTKKGALSCALDDTGLFYSASTYDMLFQHVPLDCSLSGLNTDSEAIDKSGRNRLLEYAVGLVQRMVLEQSSSPLKFYKRVAIASHMYHDIEL